MSAALDPLADLVLSRLERGTDEPYRLGAAALEEIGDALTAALDAPGLRQRLVVLVEVAHFLDTEQRCPRLAAAVLEVAAAAAATLDGAKSALPAALDRLQGAARSFARFEGDRPKELPATDKPALSAAFLSAQISKHKRRV